MPDINSVVGIGHAAEPLEFGRIILRAFAAQELKHRCALIDACNDGAVFGRDGVNMVCCAHAARAFADPFGIFRAQQRRAEELSELDRAKTAFFSNISHEFRTPLNSILSLARTDIVGLAAHMQPFLGNIGTTPGGTAITVSANGPCDQGLWPSLGFQLMSEPPTMKAAIHTLLM